MLIRVPLFLAFPLLSHLAVELHRPWLQCAALVCAAAGVFFKPLREGRPAAWLGLALFAAADLLLIGAGGGAYVLYLPSLLVPGLVLSAFAPSLLPGRVPLITRIADSINGPLSPPQLRYTRIVTWIWTCSLIAILLVTLALLLFWSAEAWSVFANLLSYLLLGALFAGEFAVRRALFPENAPLNFRAFLRSLSIHGPH